VTLQIVEQVGRTDVGRQRSVNEDSLVLAPPFFAVADGMGGARAGEVASAMAADAFEGETDAGEPPEAQLARILRAANRRIYDLAVADDSHRGMGTTVTAAKVTGDEVSLGHVGDSRAYRLRDGELEQLTRDHSLVAELERSGQITPEAAEHHPQRSIITRALGPEPDVQVDTYTVPGRPGDVYLICSDGLSDMVDTGTIEEILRANRSSLEAASKALVQAANRGGGEDNITAILFEVVDDGTETSAAEPDAPTVEAAAVGFDEEDTLHPEDNVQPPPAAPSSVDTMVIPADEIRAAVDAAEEKPHVPFGRRVLVVLVILALIAVIVALVLWGLAR
jgi:serine/threonine protein phosphatase PrpC